MSIGTWLFTLFNGKLVGSDEDGNRYYIERRTKKGYRRRRWVVYEGPREATRVSPEWHAWLHYTVDETPAENPTEEKPWQKEHIPNLTGTPEAYRPAGHEYKGGKRAAATGDYEPWTPA